MVSTTTIIRYFHRGYLLSICLDCLDGPFWQHGDYCLLLKFQFNSICYFYHNKIIFHLADTANNAAGGNNFVTFLQAGNQISVFLGALGLGTPDHQIKHHQKTAKQQKLDILVLRSSGSGVSVGHRDEKAHVLTPDLLFSQLVAALASHAAHRIPAQTATIYPALWHCAKRPSSIDNGADYEWY